MALEVREALSRVTVPKETDKWVEVGPEGSKL